MRQQPCRTPGTALAQHGNVLKSYRHQYERSCEWCAASFISGNRAQRYCRVDCRTKACKARCRQAPWYLAPVDCVVCGVTFCRLPSSTPRRNTCSDTCRSIRKADRIVRGGKRVRFGYTVPCEECGEPFRQVNGRQRFCGSRCWSRRKRKAAAQRTTHWTNIPRECLRCGTRFYRTLAAGPNQKYCSRKCATCASEERVQRFKETNPSAMQAYNVTRYAKHGKDTVLMRLRRRYPDLPTTCEAKGCSEARILEIAHKPQFKRNGAWRTMAVYERHMFWLLCPTCHRLLDTGLASESELGLLATDGIRIAERR